MSRIRETIAKADAAKDVGEEVKEILQELMEIAELKGKSFSDDIEKDLRSGTAGDSLKVAIRKVIRHESDYRAVTKNSFSDIVNVIKDSVNDMITDSSAGGIVNGVSSIVNGLVTMLTGLGEGQEQEMRRYIVTVDHAAIVRLDLAFWGRRIKAKSLTDYCETAVTCVCYKSSVDVPELSFNDFLALYMPVLRAAYGEDMRKIDEMLDQSWKLYKKYGGKDKPEELNAAELAARIPGDSGLRVSLPVAVDRGRF